MKKGVTIICVVLTSLFLIGFVSAGILDDISNWFKDIFSKGVTGNAIVCSSNSDCGTNSFSGSYSCNATGVIRDYIIYFCSNAGTDNSSCGTFTQVEIVDKCNNGETCVSGKSECETVAKNDTATCTTCSYDCSSGTCKYDCSSTNSCKTKEDCERNQYGKWCNSDVSAWCYSWCPKCMPTTLSGCDNQVNCTTMGGNWCSESCQSSSCSIKAITPTPSTTTSTTSQPTAPSILTTPNQPTTTATNSETSNKTKESEKKECDGCFYYEKCLAYGHKIKINNDTSYCSIEGIFQKQKELNEECLNDHECKSDECGNNKCISTTSLLENLFKKITNFFDNFFKNFYFRPEEKETVTVTNKTNQTA